MLLSIVIPAKNEQAYLPKLLASLAGQKALTRDSRIELIVAVDTSRDATSEIARSFGARVVRGSWGHPGPTRNAGAASARGEVLLFLDADVVLPPGFIESNLREFLSRRLDIATTYVRPDSGRFADRFIHGWWWNAWYWAMQRVDPHAAGFCLFVRRKLFDKLGGFDPSIRLGEDHALLRRAVRDFGAKFGLLHGPRVIVSVRRLEKEGRLRFVAKMLAAWAHRTFFGEIRQGGPSYSFER